MNTDDRKLSRSEVKRLLATIADPFSRDECSTCECFQGFLTQLELDAGSDVSDLLGPHKADAAKIHSCTGCHPCPSSEAFADYLRNLGE